MEKAPSRCRMRFLPALASKEACRITSRLLLRVRGAVAAAANEIGTSSMLVHKNLCACTYCSRKSMCLLWVWRTTNHTHTTPLLSFLAPPYLSPSSLSWDIASVRIASRAGALLSRLRWSGNRDELESSRKGPFRAQPVAASFLAQVMHFSGQSPVIATACNQTPRRSNPVPDPLSHFFFSTAERSELGPSAATYCFSLFFLFQKPLTS